METYSLEYRDDRPPQVSSQDPRASDGLDAQQMGQLLAVIESANRGLELEQVLDQVYEGVKPFIPCNRLGLALIDAEGKYAYSRWVRSDRGVRLGAGYHAPLEGSSLGSILSAGKVRIINDLARYGQEHPESTSTRLLLDEGMRSSLTCPLIVRGKATGFLFFTSTEPDAYSNAELTFYQQIAGQIAILVEKARLYSDLAKYAQTVERQNQRMTRELQLAAQLQRTFIPESAPRIQGLDVELLYQPLDKVGGDLVELVPLDDHRLLVFVADAMGHGVPAAMAMAIVKATFLALLREGAVEPPDVLGQLNRALPPMLRNHFAAAIAVLVDSRTRRASVARAAAPPIVILKAQTCEVTIIQDGGLPLSVNDSEPYANVEFDFPVGDLIVLGTDGLTESMNAGGEQYGTDRLVAIARTCRDGSAHECLQRLSDDLLAFRGDLPAQDDTSIVLIRSSA